MNQFEKEQVFLQALPQDPEAVKRRENMKQCLLEFLQDFCEAYGADGCCIDFEKAFLPLPEPGKEQPSPYPRYECSFAELHFGTTLFAIEYPHPEQEVK